MSLYTSKQQATNLIAFASLKHNNEPVNIPNLIAEKARLERILAQEYINSPDIEFNQFCLNWIKQNGKDFVFTDKWLFDIDIPDDSFELNVNTLINKLHRKQ